MSFVAHVPQSIYDTSPSSVVVHYNLPERFLYLPNQFSKHKNHMVVLEGLKILGKRGIRPFVVCTGHTHDPRNPAYFDDLVKNVALWDLHGRIALLGLVPRDHVFHLIRQSTCVINPSLFEGWSTSVEEAKSIGKRVLVSDLAVHREQDPPMATYFDPRSPEDLADKLAKVWADGSPGPDFELEQNAQKELPMRMQRYADTFVSIAREAVGMARGRYKT
jgi:glycosyltransferase involved in cell wall biosynthesis